MCTPAPGQPDDDGGRREDREGILQSRAVGGAVGQFGKAGKFIYPGTVVSGLSRSSATRCVRQQRSVPMDGLGGFMSNESNGPVKALTSREQDLRLLVETIP